VVDLCEYHESMGDEQIYVWVNPPFKKQNELETLRRVALNAWARLSDETKEADWRVKLGRLLRRININTLKRTQTAKIVAASDALYGWWADMFSQHENEDTYWSIADLREIAETEPTFWYWLQQRSFCVMEEWQREQKKKASTRP